MDRAWARCLEIAGITKRFTLHGLRYTFTDLVRLANVDAVVRRALTGHVTEEMQRHYSTVGMEEKRAAVAGVLRVVDGGLSKSGTNDGTEPKAKGHATSEGSTSRPMRTANSNTSLERDTGFEPATFSLGS
jgi:hypothetical protein